MAAALRLFVDIQARKLVASKLSAADASPLVLRQGETIPVQLFLLDSTNGTTANPYPAYWTPVGASIKMGVCQDTPTGSSDVIVAFQDVWTSITHGFSANLGCNTSEMATALTNRASRPGTLEIEVTESGGSPVKLVQVPVTLQAAVIDDADPVPTPEVEYPTRPEVAAQYVKRTGLPGETHLLVSPDGTKARELGVDNDGNLISTLIDPYTP